MLVVHHSDSMEALPTLNTHGRPIILIGLMGCGKTTVGKALSKRTGMPLLDTDAIIEELRMGHDEPEQPKPKGRPKKQSTKQSTQNTKQANTEQP